MSPPGAAAREPARDQGAAALYVVTVVDEIEGRLAGHAGCAYTSPAQHLADALALVSLLLGGQTDELNGARHWTRPIAGGRRTVTLAHADTAPTPPSARPRPAP